MREVATLYHLFNTLFPLELISLIVLGAFMESFGNVPMSANGNPAHSFDTGLTYKPRNQYSI